MKSLIKLFPIIFYMFVLTVSDSSSSYTTIEITALNKFSSSLYKIVAGETERHKNILVSPSSVASILAMTLVGAKGSTAKQIKTALKLPETEDSKVICIIGKLTRKISPTIKTVNRIFIADKFKVSRVFELVTANQFGAVAQNVNFSSSATLGIINKQVSDLTEKTIQNFIPQGYLDSLTKMILLSAVYFKGTWLNQFKPSRTKTLPFYLGSLHTAVPAKLMRSNGYYRTANLNEINARALELPYSGRAVSMIILLPTKIGGLKLLESSITYNYISSLDSRLRTKRFDAVMIPKFKTDASFDLVGFLQKLGVTDLFNERLANLSGISESNQDDLFVSNAFHRSFIEVNEKGTEAAAASAFMMRARSYMLPRPILHIFKVDHPFLYFIQDNLTKTIIFIGRCYNPNKL